ncbi:GTPase ObgE [Lactiplantibacillus xiangfangensis]|uniref:GTPase Obg n=1 Tax=Lactiplantibacillus xiangfangensis TaxID=942150 RepID=A0A0R2M4I1_9LACO|nr:GTPase ObgE [Lactiplantibacillus xiangfangensis]KRO08741.1 gtpase obg (gtp-binding protein obg) [Lactiplantibacillus xiangfangensis]
MFVDQVKVDVKAGNGGNGMVAFRREKFVPNGGPAGGDGGRGGSIVLQADEGLRTLMDFRYTRKFKADNGGNGMIKQMTGRSAKDRVINVPLGTVVTDAETGALIGDITEKGQKLVVAKGGRGGRGNIHFASPKNPAPEISENGEPGGELTIRMELKVLADVGLVGFPSVGKSTLLSVVTSAKPKIAAYHFTTLVPNLGMVRLDDGRDFVMADLPGLIEGAANGVGLGIQFLRHIERTRVILHLIDMSGIEENDPFEDYLKINHELTSYDPDLLKRPQIVVATKMDMPDSADNLAEFKTKLAADKTLPSMPEIYPISSITQQGIKPLLAKTADLLDTTPQFPVKGVDDVEHRDYTTETSQDFTIDNPEEGLFVLSGEKLERLFKMTNLDHEESLMRFARQLRGMGIDDGLRAAGAKNGDTIQILDYSFQFMD